MIKEYNTLVEDSNLFIQCSDGAHAIELSGFKDEPFIYVSFWNICGKNTFWWELYERIKIAAKILWYGKFCIDEIVLEESVCNELVKYLENLKWSIYG